MKKLYLVLVAFVLAISLIACGESKEIEEIEENTKTEAVENKTFAGDYETETSQGTPVVSGVDTNDFSMVDTPDSSCFSKIGYNADDEMLFVTFRDSGSSYIYDQVPQRVWDNLLNADSMGSYYNQRIKGEYSCEKLY